VQTRWIREVATRRVFAQEASDVRVVEAGLEVVKPGLVALVSGEPEGVATGADAAAAFSPGVVLVARLERSVRTNEVADASQPVEEIELSPSTAWPIEQTVRAVVVLGDGRSRGVGLEDDAVVVVQVADGRNARGLFRDPEPVVVMQA
jgi:hypothetical protein